MSFWRTLLKGAATAGGFALGGIPLAVASLLGANKTEDVINGIGADKRKADADKAAQDEQAAKDAALNETLARDAQQRVDASDERINQSALTEMRRQRTRASRSSSFLTGPGGSIANASLLGGLDPSAGLPTLPAAPSMLSTDSTVRRRPALTSLDAAPLGPGQRRR